MSRQRVVLALFLALLYFGCFSQRVSGQEISSCPNGNPIDPNSNPEPTGLWDYWEPTNYQKNHTGVDFMYPQGHSLYATGDGVIDHAEWWPQGWESTGQGHGPTLWIRHFCGGQTIWSVYAHMNLNSVHAWKVGDTVRRGDLIGEIGGPGMGAGSGPHLHYAIAQDPPQTDANILQWQNPRDFLGTDFSSNTFLRTNKPSNAWDSLRDVPITNMLGIVVFYLVIPFLLLFADWLTEKALAHQIITSSKVTTYVVSNIRNKVLFFGVLYLLVIFVYHPIWPKESYSSISAQQQIWGDAQLDQIDWELLAKESGYNSPELLRSFYAHCVPRGANGFPDPNGKVFPCALAAAIAAGETNTSDWATPDPRTPGPWGQYLGYSYADPYFGRGTQISNQCKRGLEAIALNADVQRKYPGITAQAIYSSIGCSVGRGQTLASHFAPGGMLASLPSKDVWGSYDVGIEAIYVHMVIANHSRCGAEQSWFYSSSEHMALCSYNPYAWGDPSASWYWAKVKLTRVNIELALARQLNGDFSQPVPAEVVVPSDAGIFGSGVYSQWDTMLSLTLKGVRKFSDQYQAFVYVEGVIKLWGNLAFSPYEAEMLGFR